MKVASINTLSKFVVASVIGTAVVVGDQVSSPTGEKSTNNEVADLRKEFTDYKRTISELKQSLGEEQKLNQNQAKLLEDLGQTLSTKITLDQINTIVEKVAPSTVTIEGEQDTLDFHTGQMIKMPTVGSGVILVGDNDQRYILTCEHVLENAAIKNDEHKDGAYKIKLYNGSDYDKPVEFFTQIATLKDNKQATSPKDKYDLALLTIPKDVKLPDGVGIKIRDLKTSPLKLGEPLISVGAPIANRDSMTFGILSHRDRSMEGANSTNRYLQTDATISPGSSGGGLFDMQGNLVGINELKNMFTDGVAYSIRADYVNKALVEWNIKLK